MAITDNTTFKKKGFGEFNGHSSLVLLSSNFGKGCVITVVFVIIVDDDDKGDIADVFGGVF